MTTNGWIDAFVSPQLPRRFCIELFAGACRITQALTEVSLDCLPIDICISKHHNMLDWGNEHKLVHWLQGGRISFLWIGMPISTFAQKAGLRSAAYPQGLPELTGSHLREVQVANTLLRVCVRLMQLCENIRIPYAFESPAQSFAWITPNIVKFTSKCSPTFAAIDFCQFGTPWRRPTTLMGNFWPLQKLSRQCHPIRNICSQTHQPHVALAGTDDCGCPLGLKAQPYPRALAASVGITLAQSIQRSQR